MSDNRSWRLITSIAMSGALNMAIDESILEAVAGRDKPPTLRLYAWSPPCLSLGHAQQYSDIDPERISEQGWSVVRRSTGGRAILHTDELTYAVIAPINHPDLAGGVMPSYKRLSRALLSGLDYLGLEVSIAPDVQMSEQERSNPICFEIPSAYEIEVAGQKLLGSAQVRRVKGVLQHGTLPLKGDITRVCEALYFTDEEARQKAKERLRGRAVTLSELLGDEVSFSQVAGALVHGFQDALGWQLQESDLSPAELDRALELKRDRFANPEWTKRI